ncbi:hypothetical protein E2C01_044903 [Portunus trituberculatus]|uniref:Uncharacterized protein n=1 Tax=Portunus trituberculatus TaxID=210409 RepID=A0A5B7FZL5_PORTR|nr:hypothetical protein [Portunus trituberculatus]
MTDDQSLVFGNSPLSNMVRNMSGEPLESTGVSCANCSRSFSVSILLFRRAVKLEHQSSKSGVPNIRVGEHSITGTCPSGDKSPGLGREGAGQQESRN